MRGFGNQLISVSASSGFIASNASIAVPSAGRDREREVADDDAAGASAFTNTPIREVAVIARWPG